MTQRTTQRTTHPLDIDDSFWWWLYSESHLLIEVHLHLLIDVHFFSSRRSRGLIFPLPLVAGFNPINARRFMKRIQVSALLSQIHCDYLQTSYSYTVTTTILILLLTHINSNNSLDLYTLIPPSYSLCKRALTSLRMP